MPPSHGAEVSGVPLNQSPVPGLLLPVTNAKSALGTSSKMCWGEALPGGDSTLKKARASFPLPLPSYQGLSVFELLNPVAPSRGSKCLFQSPGIPIPAQGGRQRAQAWPVWEGPWLPLYCGFSIPRHWGPLHPFDGRRAWRCPLPAEFSRIWPRINTVSDAHTQCVRFCKDHTWV